MKIAIIGCGMIADAHVKVINKIDDTQIVAVCDKEPLMAEQLADRYNIADSYTDIGELIDKTKPDVVHILTPPSTHLSIGIAALEAGCHVLLEKPFTLNGEEAKALINKAESVGRKITVNHFHNFSPPALRLRRMVCNGELGDIMHMEGFYSYGMKSPVAQALIKDRHSWVHQLPGKVIQNNIDHLICKFVEFLPDDQPTVRSYAKSLSREVRQVKYSHIHDELRVMITGENVSAYGTFSSNVYPFRHTLTVYATRGTVCIDYESRSFVVSPVSYLPGPFGKLATPFLVGKRYVQEGIKNLFDFSKSNFHFYAGAHTLFREFYQCIKENNDTVPIPYEDIIKVTFIMEEIFEQMNNHLPVEGRGRYYSTDEKDVHFSQQLIQYAGLTKVSVGT